MNETNEADDVEEGAESAFRQALDGSVMRSLKRLEIANAPPPEVGSTPKDVLYERGTLRLYHYRATTDEVYRVPLLIVMATTNKGYLFDLMPGQSMVEYLVNEGYDVYMIDWVEPVPEERKLSLADYTQDFIPRCIRKVQQESGEEEVTLVGYCQGGVLALIYAATNPQAPVKNLVFFTTPVDQHKMNLARVWSDPRFSDVDGVVDAYGIIPAEMMKSFFEMLRPAQKTAAQLRLWEQSDDAEFVASFRVVERWGDETLGLPGQYYRDTTKELMWDNKLFKGELVVANKLAKLANITVPVLHAVAQHDHIVPYASSKPLLEMVGSTDKQEIVMKGGHVSLVAGPRAVGRLWPQVNEWLATRSI